jgi:hypothetical protein
MAANTRLIHELCARSINPEGNETGCRDCERQSLNMLFSNKFLLRKILFGMTILAIGCTDSPESVSVSTKKTDRRINHLLSTETYDRALAVASTPEEQTIVKACRRLEGKRKTPNIDPETVQTMQEVLFESAAPEVRAAVAAGLGNAGNVDATPSLLDAMEDDALVTRQAAAKAVGKLMGWRQGFQPDDPRDKRAEAVERFRERWLLFEGSDLYQVATNPEARERAGAIAEKRAKFLRRKERMNARGKDNLQKNSPKSKEELPPQRRPTPEELRRQFKQYKDELEQYKEN